LSLPMVPSMRLSSLYFAGSKALLRGIHVRCGKMGWAPPLRPRKHRDLPMTALASEIVV
jgi:hypothetical protein